MNWYADKPVIKWYGIQPTKTMYNVFPAKVNEIPVQKEERNTHITPLQIFMGLTFYSLSMSS